MITRIVKSVIWVLVIIVAIGLVLGAMYIDAQRAKEMPPPSYAHPSVYIERQPSIETNIDQIAELNGTIYLLDDHKGILTAYDSDGNYKYTVSFLTHIGGTFSMAVSDDKLYVRDERYNIYIFENEVFQVFLKKKDAEHILRTVDFHARNSSYQARFNLSVWKIDEEEPVCIISRPYTVLLANGRGFGWIGIIFVIVIAMLRRPGQPVKRVRETGDK